ncbi:hypothetical protein OH76DRAFT_1401157 [Lentinus brumalis]|uniref:Uncharacterized protein n=1 Tax=Lentinus brumalis TaxID=2498619 RepID=A0A371DGR3_9APHY|nr:hypothetical protein OH76DRAFT_1401157 [Polyporus brumalis]
MHVFMLDDYSVLATVNQPDLCHSGPSSLRLTCILTDRPHDLAARISPYRHQAHAEDHWHRRVFL